MAFNVVLRTNDFGVFNVLLTSSGGVIYQEIQCIMSVPAELVTGLHTHKLFYATLSVGTQLEAVLDNVGYVKASLGTVAELSVDLQTAITLEVEMGAAINFKAYDSALPSLSQQSQVLQGSQVPFERRMVVLDSLVEELRSKEAVTYTFTTESKQDNLIRTAIGEGSSITGWAKANLALYGTGAFPSILDSLRLSEVLSVKTCAPQMTHSSLTTIAVLPIRTDVPYEPKCFVDVYGKEPTEFEISFTDTSITVTNPAAGETVYRFVYYRVMDMLVDSTSSDWDDALANFMWSVTLREV